MRPRINTPLALGLMVAVLLMGPGACSDAGSRPPEGWRWLRSGELSNLRRAQIHFMGPETPQSRYRVSGDFDGDGLQDRALILIDDELSDAAFRLFVLRGAGGPAVRTSIEGFGGELWARDLRVAQADAYATRCARDGEATCPAQVLMRRPAIEWRELATHVGKPRVIYVYWDGGRFQEVEGVP